MTPAGIRIRFLSPMRMLAEDSVSAPRSWLIMPITASYLRVGIQLHSSVERSRRLKRKEHHIRHVVQ
ncbi:hypothetical protein EYF80_007640 [Liparis tanakae]|uniref:Uncharacterized protein n=1 Tax=Liparis tanakae TaxID=230148 RepID=A0A4Z2IWR8_9TELE|nr:hypothetical protein EYF80_007640 [Liparis tanakae]